MHLLAASHKPCNKYQIQGRHFNFFSEGQIFKKFFNATRLLKNWKKQHFICSNLTLFIVPFFLSLFFFSFFSFFIFSFFYFSFGGDGPPAPLKWRPWPDYMSWRRQNQWHNRQQKTQIKWTNEQARFSEPPFSWAGRCTEIVYQRSLRRGQTLIQPVQVRQSE